MGHHTPHSPILSAILLLHVVAASAVRVLPGDRVLQTFARVSLPSTTSRAGLNGETCRTDDACAGTRQCLHVSELQEASRAPCESASTRCICTPAQTTDLLCETSETCDAGERCVYTTGSVYAPPVCFSCAVVAKLNNAAVVDAGKCVAETTPRATPDTEARDTPRPAPEMEEPYGDYPVGMPTTPRPTPVGPPGEETEPVPLPALGVEPSPEPSTEPQSDNNYLSGQLTLPDTEPTAEPEASAEAEDRAPSGPLRSAFPEPDSSCVAAEALAGLSRSALVFREHRAAPVLCDAEGSCATRGHMVVFRGAAMTMQTYCAEHASCAARRMLVNSPRLVRGLRVASRTRGLSFTVYSARFGSQVEERIMRTLIRIGM